MIEVKHLTKKYGNNLAVNDLSFAAGLKKIPQKEQEKAIFKVMKQTGTLDVKGRLIRNLKQRHTVILSSHILSEISEICDHIMIISHGVLVASDTPGNLQGMMKESAEIELTALGTKQQAREIIGGVAGIRESRITGSREAGAVDIILKAEGEKDLRIAIFKAFAKSDVPLLRMQQKTASLEDIFLELTEDKPKEEEDDHKGGRLMRFFRKKKKADGTDGTVNNPAAEAEDVQDAETGQRAEPEEIAEEVIEETAEGGEEA